VRSAIGYDEFIVTISLLGDFGVITASRVRSKPVGQVTVIGISSLIILRNPYNFELLSQIRSSINCSLRRRSTTNIIVATSLWTAKR